MVLLSWWQEGNINNKKKMMSKTETLLPWFTKTNTLRETVVWFIDHVAVPQGQWHDKGHLIIREGNATVPQKKAEAGPMSETSWLPAGAESRWKVSSFPLHTTLSLWCFLPCPSEVSIIRATFVFMPAWFCLGAESAIPRGEASRSKTRSSCTYPFNSLMARLIGH